MSTNLSNTKIYADDVTIQNVTLLVLAVRAIIGCFGIVLNLALVYITIKHKYFHGSCNIMLAADALGNALYEVGLLETFFAALIIQKYYPLWRCYCLQALPMFGAIFTTTSMLFIAVDRLLSITFPIFFKKLNFKLYLVMLIGICSSYAAYITLASFQAVAASPELLVLCTLSECYQPKLGEFVGRNGSVIQITTITLYFLLGAVIRMAEKKQTSASFAFTRQIYKSLMFIIMFLCFNLMFNFFVLQLLPSFQQSKLASLHLSLTSAYLPNIAGATHALVLYTFSNEYRKAFQLYIRCSMLETGSSVYSSHKTTAVISSLKL